MKLLFIGNSHTYFNDMPHTVGELYRLCGLDTPDVTMLTVGGMSLDWHAGQPSVWFSLKYGGFDKVILQDVAHPFAGEEPLLSGAGSLIARMDRARTTPCFYMTWASLANPSAQADMTAAYTKAAAEYDALLAPVGRVWEKIRYGHPEIDLFWQDGEHASPYGSYLAACTIFCALTGSTCPTPDMTDPFYDSLDKDACAVIHAAVAEVMGARG